MRLVRERIGESEFERFLARLVPLPEPKPDATEGGRAVLVTSDLIGVPRSLAVAVAEQVRKRTGLPRERLMLTCSHTH